jgi:hypothetical protein
MSEKAIDQMISAFATGSLDRENFVQFRSYIQKGGKLPKGELGEQQNVMSLIPTILDIEQPEKRTKALVAKRIIEIQEKIKSSSKADSESQVKTAIPTTPEKPAIVEQEEIEPQELKRKSLHDTGGPGSPASGPAVTKEKIPPTTLGSIVPWVLVFFMLIALIISTFYFINMNSEMEQQVTEVKDQLHSFQSEIANTNEFINDHLKLVDFFNYSDVRIVNLLSMSEKSDAWGRLLISFKSGEGLLQLKNMPDLDGREVYQVWMVSKDVTFPLAAITPSIDVKYYEISNIPYIPERDVNLFRVTKEADSDVMVPEGTAYLYGIFLKETLRRR